jgi:hypothetical protein
MNKIFAKTWSKRAGQTPKEDFWIEVISAVRSERSDFVFLAETYWDTEEGLVNQGFDFCYDKTLYDLLLDGDNQAVEKHLGKTRNFQDRLARFIENHDEDRASSTYMEMHEAAAAVIATLPGLWLFHDGQAEGYRTKIPVHLARGPEEETDQELFKYYEKLLKIISKWDLGVSKWQLIENDNEDLFSWQWTNEDGIHLVLINYGGSKAHIKIPITSSFYDELNGKTLKPTASALDIKLNPWQTLLLSRQQPH